MFDFIRLLKLAVIVATVPLIWAIPHASALTFDMVAPGAEGDDESAQPILQEFYSYLKTHTGESWQGTYHNDDADEIIRFLKKQKRDLAVVSHIFQQSEPEHVPSDELVKTIPLYSDGPAETYYLMGGEKPDQKPERILSSAAQESLSLKTLFPDKKNLHNKKIRVSFNLVKDIGLISSGASSHLVLLSGYEYSVIQKLKNTRPDFQKLKLLYASNPQPSAKVVVLNPKVPVLALKKLKQTLLRMGTDPEGRAILKKLRLKGFVE